MIDLQAPEHVWNHNMNPEQLAVIHHDDGPLVVDAGAGSGKTRAVVHRIARLVAAGVPSKRILAVTFSKKAADEMNARLDQLGVQGARVGTWHSLCLQILREDRTQWAKWKIDERDRAKYILKNVIGWQGLKWQTDLGELRKYIGICKAHLWAPGSRPAKKLAAEMYEKEGPTGITNAAKAFVLYQRGLEAEELLTFDDFLTFTYRHLTEGGQGPVWARRWDYVIQDEGQDTNDAQCAIVDVLVEEHKNYMIVGDVGQSIYGFRGSSPAHVADFHAKYPGAQKIAMRRNYRSGAAIIEAANRVIEQGEHHGADMIAERGMQGHARHVCTIDLDDEGRAVAQWVTANVADDGAAYRDHTVLFRTNAQSRALEEAFLDAKIPYIVLGGGSFYDRKEVRDLLAYLRIGADRDEDGESVRRSINAPFRFLGARFVDRLMTVASQRKPKTFAEWSVCMHEVGQQERIASRQLDSIASWCRIMGQVHDAISAPKEGSTAGDVLTTIVRDTGYLEYIKKEDGEDSIEQSGMANVNEFLRVAAKFKTVADLLDYIDYIQTQAKDRRMEEGSNAVMMMSIHKSKGLEWPRVWVVGCVESILPHGKGDEEEERRLAYVAFTRARDELVTSSVETIATKAGIKKPAISRFVVDAGLASG